jgi:hypothetical protein
VEGEDAKGMTDPVTEWENIIHKNVRTKDFRAVGRVVAIERFYCYHNTRWIEGVPCTKKTRRDI